ncbi:hypothetical protein ABK040_002484 [Willaertia magna]
MQNKSRSALVLKGLLKKTNQTTNANTTILKRQFNTKLNIQQKQVPVHYTKLFIGGQWVDGKEGKSFSVINPSTEEEICKVSEATESDVNAAVEIARKTFENVWKDYPPSKRSKVMLRWADLIEQHADYIADLESMDNGKPREMVKNVDIYLVLECIRYFAGWCDKIHGATIPQDGDKFVYTLKEPVGVVAQIVPWNFPLLMATWKWAPALAAGCVSILKTAEQTPLSALYVASLAKEAGIPDGVINVLSGFGETAGSPLVKHLDVDKVSFTGSTEVGRKIQIMAAQSNLKNVTLELGGKSPLLVLDEVQSKEQLEFLAHVCHQGVFFNQGQVCSCSSRLFVNAKIYDEFLEITKKKAEKRIVGDPFHPQTEQGAQVSKEQFDKILDYIEHGKKEAKLLTGGKRVGNRGYFIEPTVFYDVKDDAKIAQEEIFGPVMSVLKFDDVDEAIHRANTTTYGLAAGVLTNDLNKAIRAAKGLKAGTVWVNCWNSFSSSVPFGGYKQSGIGRDLGREALDGYLETKSVVTAVPHLKHSK